MCRSGGCLLTSAGKIFVWGRGADALVWWVPAHIRKHIFFGEPRCQGDTEEIYLEGADVPVWMCGVPTPAQRRFLCFGWKCDPG